MTTTYGSKITWTAVAGAEYYRVYRDPSNGTGIYAWVGDTQNEVFEDYNVSPDTSDAPPSEYEPFSGTDDKPSSVGYFQQREVFANTNNAPQSIFMTQLSNYNSMRFSRPARTDDAIFFTIKSLQVNEIRHIVGLDSLIFLTSGAVWKLTEGQDRILTPLSIGLRVQNYWGCSWTKPVVIGDSIVFVQEKGTKIRDLSYEFVDDKYRGSDLSILAQHLFDGYTVDEMAYADEPFSVLWSVRSDGTLLGLTYHKEQNVVAWHQHESASGVFESVATISEDGRDAAYFIVKRVVDGSTVRYIERMQERVTSSAADVWCVDSGLQYSGSAATTITGLDHLEGEEVVAVADGNVVTGLTVSSGEIELTKAAEKVTVGLAYTPTIELLELDTGSITGPRGRKASVNNVMVEFKDSRGGWVGTVDDQGNPGTLQEIPARYVSDGYDPLSLKSFKQDVTVPGTWERGLQVRIEQRVPMPMSILAVIPDVEFSS
jgi:acyl dehydratase